MFYGGGDDPLQPPKLAADWNHTAEIDRRRVHFFLSLPPPLPSLKKKRAQNVTKHGPPDAALITAPKKLAASVSIARRHKWKLCFKKQAEAVFKAGLLGCSGSPWRKKTKKKRKRLIYLPDTFWVGVSANRGQVAAQSLGAEGTCTN